MSLCNSTGRPTKYSADIVTFTNSYVRRCQKEREIPFMEELALEIGVNGDTLVEWSKLHADFSAAIDSLKMLQKLCLQKGALKREYHSQMAVFLLKANHKMGNESSKDNGLLSTILAQIKQ